MHIQFGHSNSNPAFLTQNPEKSRLLMDISQTKMALENAYAGFENAVDPDLIDCYIYEVNSVLKRYKYLLAQMEKLDMTENEDSGLCPEPSVYSFIG